MVGVSVSMIVVIILLVLVIGIQIETRLTGSRTMNEYDEAIDEMKNSLIVVATVMQKLPDMVPQFQINENPLSQILQFFQQRAENQQTETSYPGYQKIEGESEGSLDDNEVRDANGRFSDGKND